ncbi:Rieske (2Fe-2S) protein [Oceanospirillum sediminis]|uniref:Non-heme iron oxygenase ferredoxin subunit n=1 Tax=Oceanospirillum sediminis TaxID=2760088 RepID=A0A839IKV5_9GAMM|nr:non-heme iron oxygenase ferredoxin subunit [Oceanospirillum sediminis]MBB1485172.1 non-heme iron oxygenase ferredoxin subunit [Oceanospirillum sediminis]
MAWIKVDVAAAIADGEYQLVTTEDDVELLVANVDGEFHAIENLCTHDNGSLEGGCIEDGEIVCPRHGARFCLRSGEVTAPPAYENVDVYPVRIIDGVVEVSDEPDD